MTLEARRWAGLRRTATCLLFLAAPATLGAGITVEECRVILAEPLPGPIDLLAVDCNGNGILDSCDIRDGVSKDADLNGIPDECVPPDVCRIATDPGTPTLEDCNQNGLLDVCELRLGLAKDENQDGLLDECKLPDFCTPEPGSDSTGLIDCNQNGVRDACDIRLGTSKDADLNGIPDECSIPDLCKIDAALDVNGALDCNKNGLRDACDLRRGTSEDADKDGIPDECAPDDNHPVRVFRRTLSSAETLATVGYVPQETVDFIEANSDALILDERKLLDALAVTDFQVASAGEVPAGVGGGGSGGLINGSFLFAVSSQGLFVGAFYPQAVWDDAADPCHRAITGHTYVGGVLNAVCNAFQIGNVFPDTCPPTTTCSSLTKECIAVQVQCQQIFGPTLNNFSAPTEILCPPCEEATQLPGDCNSDASIDLGDAICLLGHIFLGSPSRLACGDGTSRAPSNIALLDWNGDSRIDIADPISNLAWLFGTGGGPGAPHILGESCTAIPDCPAECGN